MKGSTFLLCAALAVLMGFLAQQSVEVFVNTSLTLLPFNIRII